MNGPHLNLAESLRDLTSAKEPDPRTRLYMGQERPSLTTHHADIANIRLCGAVPEPIAIQFETARNLYLYAWHVYRFYMVAAAQALSTLELGLRTRLPDQLPAPYQRTGQKRPMLAGLLRYAIDQGLVRNEGFRRWHEAAAHQARERLSMSSIQTMLDNQLGSLEFDEINPLDITLDDQRWDLVRGLLGSLPTLRNELAHGSSMLTRDVLGILELVAEILGQLYSS